MPTGTPTYITIGPNGEINAEFTGTVTATGLILPASVEEPPKVSNKSKIVWRTEEGTGAVVAEILAGTTTGPGSPNQIFQRSEAIEDVAEDGTEDKSTSRLTSGAVAGQTAATVTAQKKGGSNNFRTIINDKGESNFLQWEPPNQQPYFMKFANEAILIPAGWSTATLKFIPAFPKFVFAIFGGPFGGAGASIISWSMASLAVTQVQYFINSSIEQTVTFLALGIGN